VSVHDEICLRIIDQRAYNIGGPGVAGGNLKEKQRDYVSICPNEVAKKVIAARKIPNNTLNVICMSAQQSSLVPRGRGLPGRA
jgi:hypothetical protein